MVYVSIDILNRVPIQSAGVVAPGVAMRTPHIDQMEGSLGKYDKVPRHSTIGS